MKILILEIHFWWRSLLKALPPSVSKQTNVVTSDLQCLHFGNQNMHAALVIFYFAAKYIFTLLLKTKSSKAKQISKVNSSRISSLHLILWYWTRSTVKTVTKLKLPWFVWLSKGKAIKVPLDLHLTCSFKYLLEHSHFGTPLSVFEKWNSKLGKKSAWD